MYIYDGGLPAGPPPPHGLVCALWGSPPPLWNVVWCAGVGYGPPPPPLWNVGCGFFWFSFGFSNILEFLSSRNLAFPWDFQYFGAPDLDFP